MNRRILAAAAALSLAACGGGLETQDIDELKAARKTATSSPTYALKATDADVSGATPTWKTSFPISSTYDVFIATEITGTLSGHHTQTVFVFAPGGWSYQRFDVSFATDVAAYPGEQQAVKTSTGWRVWVTLPVAGTMIQTSNLAGTWTTELFVDSSATAKANGSFSLY